MKEKGLDIVHRALLNWTKAETATQRSRMDYVDDMEFKLGKQWPDSIMRERMAEQRPCLTINKFPQYVHQITNEARQNKPRLRVFPVDDQGDIETAKILEGMIRHTEEKSGASAAYDTAINCAVSGGFGYYRVITQFEDPMSFNQEIRIKRIIDPLSVYLDPAHTEPDYSDIQWGMVVEDVNLDLFKAEHPESLVATKNMTAQEITSFNQISLGAYTNVWVNANSIRIAEYFEKTYEKATIVMIDSGEVMLEKQAPEDSVIIGKRKTYLPKIKWYKMSSVEILEETEWLGIYIPIIPVLGDETFFNGEYITESLIRHSKDSQRMYNYWASAETETIALSPKSPFIAAEGQIAGHEAEWRNANTVSYGVLQYTPVSLGGTLVPPPAKNNYEPPVAAITNARMQAAEDIKSTTGIYDAALGARSNEQTGVAINARKTQIQTSNYHFIDNFARSLRLLGLILLDLMPKIYNAKQVARIIGEDSNEQKVVKINEMFSVNGKSVTYNLTQGLYDCIVTTGPGYASRRQEAVQNMLELTRAWPDLLRIAGHLFVGKMDWDGAQEVAEQLKKALPPELAESGESPIPPELKAQMQQMQQYVQQLQQELMATMQKLDSRSEELESKERIEFAKIYAQLAIADNNAGSKETIEALKAGMMMANQRLQMLDMDEPVGEPGETVPPPPAAGPGAGSGAAQNEPQPVGGQPLAQPTE